MAERSLMSEAGRAKLTVDSLGSVITHLALNNHLILGSEMARTSQPYLYACVPNFGDRAFGPSSGKALKDTLSGFISDIDDPIGITTVTSLRNDARQEWLDVEQVFTLQETTLHLTSVLRNNGPESIFVNYGYNIQFHTPEGLSGASLNGVPIVEATSQPIQNWSDQNLLIISGKPRIVIQQRHFHYGAVSTLPTGDSKLTLHIAQGDPSHSRPTLRTQESQIPPYDNRARFLMVTAISEG